MKSVIYVCPAFPTIGAFIENEVKRLHRRGVRVKVLTLRPVPAEYQPSHRELLPLTFPMGSPWAAQNLLALLRWLVRKPHVLIPAWLRTVWAARTSVYALAGHVGYLPLACRVASIAEDENFERVHGAWAHFPATVAWLATRLVPKRFSMAGHAGGDLHRTQAFLADKVRDADFVTCCVRGNAEMVRERVPDRADRVIWLYHGTELAMFGAIRRDRSPEPVFLCVGRLADTKGFDTAIRALGVLRASGPVPRLQLAGDGPLRPRFEALARECGVQDHVDFLGTIGHDELLPLYARAWALVAPSRMLPNGRVDGIPNVVIEAMAGGLPVVGTNAAGIPEAVRHGENGLLCEPDQPEQLAALLRRLMDRPALADELGARARGGVLGEFDVEVNFERLWALFEHAGPVATSR